MVLGIYSHGRGVSTAGPELLINQVNDFTSVPNFEVEKRPIGLFCTVGYITLNGVSSNRGLGVCPELSVCFETLGVKMVNVGYKSVNVGSICHRRFHKITRLNGCISPIIWYYFQPIYSMLQPIHSVASIIAVHQDDSSTTSSSCHSEYKYNYIITRNHQPVLL